MKNFVLIGAGGYVAPRHLKAIKDTGNDLLAALDKNDSVGILDNYFPRADFFTEFERFDRHCEKLRRSNTPVHYVSVCSPNYLHDAHVRFGLRIGADVICEKPVVLNPWNVDALMEIEKETNRKVYTVLQLRLHPAIISLREKILKESAGKKYKVDLKYITARGNWYHSSWKGDVYKSGGIATNIGIHFFDVLLWIFGDVKENIVYQHGMDTASGKLKLENAEVSWMLSIDASQLPDEVRNKGNRTWRSLVIDEQEFEFSNDFDELHTRSYKEILSGKGIDLHETKKIIQLLHDIRNAGR
ncbi:MAG TPA: Gfo/Idh/MocA family oxidoreductase [Chitinophagaceae bacterium]|nr:Gfo/Idh/MocA family oxidoreductase [Chitinophagaceae bacterium]